MCASQVIVVLSISADTDELETTSGQAMSQEQRFIKFSVYTLT